MKRSQSNSKIYQTFEKSTIICKKSTKRQISTKFNINVKKGFKNTIILKRY